MRWQISQRVIGSWVTVTGKRRDDEVLICLYDASPAGMILPCGSAERAPRGRRVRRILLYGARVSTAGEHNATMTERSLVDLAESAGDELALRLRIPCDIVDVHRINNSRAKIYSSLRYGAFLLAYAPLESFFSQLTWYPERANGRALPFNLDKIQRELDLQWPNVRFQTSLWEGRTRQQPTRSGHRSEWAHLERRTPQGLPF